MQNTRVVDQHEILNIVWNTDFVSDFVPERHIQKILVVTSHGNGRYTFHEWESVDFSDEFSSWIFDEQWIALYAFPAIATILSSVPDILRDAIDFTEL